MPQIVPKMASNDRRDETQVNLLLAGRTGNGKSSTGNSILGYKQFTPSTSHSTSTPSPTKGKCEMRQNRVLNVVDGIEIDISDDNTADAKLASTMAKEAFALCPEGFSALLIVLRYGNRFTKQERDALTVIRSVFGENIVKKHGVIVMTHGDNFYQEAEEHQGRYTFQNWCETQMGAAQSLFNESGERWVLMNNKAKDEDKKEKQRNNLLATVEQVEKRNGRLTSLDKVDKTDKKRERVDNDRNLHSEERHNHMDSESETDKKDGGLCCFRGRRKKEKNKREKREQGKKSLKSSKKTTKN